MSEAGWLQAHLEAEIEQAATDQAYRLHRLRSALEVAEERIRANPSESDSMNIRFMPADTEAGL